MICSVVATSISGCDVCTACCVKKNFESNFNNDINLLQNKTTNNSCIKPISANRLLPHYDQ